MTEHISGIHSINHPKIEIVDGTNGRAMYITIDGYMFYIDNTTNEQIMECWKDDGTDGMYWKKVAVRGKWDTEHMTDNKGNLMEDMK